MRSIILITDSMPSANGAGISQTLFNLLDQYPGPIELIARPNENQPGGQCLPAGKHDWQFENFAYWNNRLGKWLNPVLVSLNFSRQQKKVREIQGISPPQNAFIFVSTTEPIKLQLAWLLQQQLGYTVVPYFMDDWLAGNPLKWKGGDIQQVAKDILQAAPCWLMISRQLEATLVKRYGLQKKPTLIIHNPAPPPIVQNFRGKIDQNFDADINDHIKHEPTKAANQTSDIRHRQIIYAGSIWPMHADALIAAAKAIHHLHRQGQTAYRLMIYTSEGHWKKYQEQLDGPGISWGGWKTYTDIQQILPGAWLLLCTASFAEQHKAFSDSSVQTKLTDYMASGKPVLFVGPQQAASGAFVEEQDTGFTIGTSLPEDIAGGVEAIAHMPREYDRKSRNSMELATTTFSKIQVQKKLYQFLKANAGLNEVVEKV